MDYYLNQYFLLYLKSTTLFTLRENSYFGDSLAPTCSKWQTGRCSVIAKPLFMQIGRLKSRLAVWNLLSIFSK